MIAVEECTLCNGMGFLDGIGSICPHCNGGGFEPVATLPAAPAPTRTKFDTGQAREFLVEWQRANFPTDRTFDEYIRKQLAGDFAWQLACALADRKAPAPTEQAEFPDMGLALMIARGSLSEIRAWGERQRQEGRRDAHETNITLVGENCKLAERLEWHKKSLAATSGKLAAVWDGIREAVEKYSGKPCVGEPFDRLDELLAALAARGGLAPTEMGNSAGESTSTSPLGIDVPLA
jgi:hypothetical protein